LRRFALIHGVLRLGYDYSSSFSGKIYIPYIPSGFSTTEDLDVPFNRQLEVSVGTAAAVGDVSMSSGGSGAERSGENDSDLDTEAMALTKSFAAGEYCHIQVSTVGLPLFEN